MADPDVVAMRADFSLRLRLEFAPCVIIAPELAKCPFGLGPYQACLEGRSQFWVMTVEGFATESEARGAAGRVWASLCSLLIERQIPWRPVPPPASSQAGAHGFEVRPSAHIASSSQVFPATVVSSPSAAQVVDGLCRGFAGATGSVGCNDESLELAVGIYANHFWETTPAARFLTLATALEVMAPSVDRPPCAQRLLDRWGDELKRALASGTASAEEEEALADLARSHMLARRESIGASLRHLVRDTLTRAGDPEVDSAVRLATYLYGKRSHLVHMGHLPEAELQDCCRMASALVRRLLKARLLPPCAAGPRTGPRDV